jgi:hypothetical protein
VLLASPLQELALIPVLVLVLEPVQAQEAEQPRLEWARQAPKERRTARVPQTVTTMLVVARQPVLAAELVLEKPWLASLSCAAGEARVRARAAAPAGSPPAGTAP